MDIKKHMGELSDLELLEKTEEARNDLELAAKEQPESEHHKNCFAGFLLYSQECKSRGITKLLSIQ